MTGDSKREKLMHAADLPESVEASIESEYSNHYAQFTAAVPTPERIAELEKALLVAFEHVIEYRSVPFIRFGDLSTQELANAFVNHPIIIKPTLCLVNVASRAVERDLGFGLDTYVPKVNQRQADQLAGMIKPMLPPAMALPAVMELDRYFWTDKQMRAHKGTWERTITEAINRVASGVFRKRKFKFNDEEFEIDAAFPATGEKIAVAVDVKRIESPRDIHKRADEIINKAAKFKKAYPRGTFVALVYYPFPTQHINVQSRVESPDIDALFFAGETESSIANAADLLVGRVGLKKK